MSSSAYTAKLCFQTPSGIKQATLYNNFKNFEDYEEGNNYVAVKIMAQSNIGYLYCSKTLWLNDNENTTDQYFFSFKGMDGEIYHAYYSCPEIKETVWDTVKTGILEYDDEEFPYGAKVYVLSTKGYNGGAGGKGGNGSSSYNSSTGRWVESAGSGGSAGAGGKGGYNATATVQIGDYSDDDYISATITAYGGYGAGGGGGGGGGNVYSSSPFGTSGTHIAYSGGAGGSAGVASNLATYGCLTVMPNRELYVGSITQVQDENYSGKTGSKGSNGNVGGYTNAANGGAGGASGDGTEGGARSGSKGGAGASTSSVKPPSISTTSSEDLTFTRGAVSNSAVKDYASFPVVVTKLSLHYST